MVIFRDCILLAPPMTRERREEEHLLDDKEFSQHEYLRQDE